jgi:hypothetical protein
MDLGPALWLTIGPIRDDKANMTGGALCRTDPLQVSSEARLNLGLLLPERGKDRIIFLPMGMPRSSSFFRLTSPARSA